MGRRFLAPFLAAALTAATALPARGWEPTKQTSWAYQDVDGSLVFFDPEAKALRTWLKGSGLLTSLPVVLPETRKPAKTAAPAAPLPGSDTAYDAAGAILYGIPRHQRAKTAASPESARAETPAACAIIPERWVTDSYSRTWMVCGHQLAVLDKDGNPGQIHPLPAPVEDMAVARDGIMLLYRTLKPYLEKRDLKTGDVIWSFGDERQAKEAAFQPLLVPLNRMAVGADGTIYLAEGASMAFTVIDSAKGPKEPGQSFFTCQDTLPPRAVLGRLGRGPMLSWGGKDVIFSVFAPGQVKSCGAPASKGLLLARFDLAKGTLDWIPTPLAEGHRLVGLLEHEAVFLAPSGGLAYAPIR